MQYVDYNGTPLDFEESFGCAFGDHGNRKISFGKRGNHASNPVDVEGSFTTPTHVEKDVSFNGGDTMMMGGDRVLVVSKRRGAKHTDPDLVGVRWYLQGQSEGRLSMFVNDTDEDPAPPKSWTGKGWGEPAPRDTWLRPGVKYYWRMYRTDLRASGEHPPMAVQYTGTSPADGEEIELGSMAGRIITHEGQEGYFFPI